MKKGLVSILLTSYNRPKMVCEAIESVLAQTYEEFELFILDDNSNHDTLDSIFKYLSFDSRIVFRNSKVSSEERFKSPGYVNNINWALEHINGEFVCYLSDDDLLTLNALQDLVSYLNENPDQSVVYGAQKILRNGTDGGLRPENRVMDRGEGIDHCQVLHRSDILPHVGFWPTNNMRAGDAEFWGKIGAAGYQFYPIQEVTSIHRYHENELSSKIERGQIETEPRE